MSASQTQLPSALETVRAELRDGVLHLTLNRPATRNAMSLQMVEELQTCFRAVAEDQQVRAIVLRGADGHFCAGGDVKDMAGARARLGSTRDDPFATLNRAFGHLLEQVEHSPQVVIAVLEGAVLGGGFGLACVSDVALAMADARFGLPETSLGIIPAQIAPFVVRRIGLTQTRRLALLGARFDGREAHRLGLVHDVHADLASLDAALAQTLDQLHQCAPRANAVTKALLLRVGQEPLSPLLDEAAQAFAQAIQGAEGQEGTLAFIQKRKPQWAQ